MDEEVIPKVPGREEDPPMAEDAGHFAQKPVGVRHMLQHIEAEDQIDRAIIDIAQITMKWLDTPLSPIRVGK